MNRLAAHYPATGGTNAATPPVLISLALVAALLLLRRSPVGHRSKKTNPNHRSPAGRESGNSEGMRR
ncbi:MAG TPA: LPXTG cell wall anchor domain-containing protein [Acidimicrobiales bacterium]